MKLSIEQLAESPRRLDFERPAEWWAERAGEVQAAEGELLAPLGFTLDASKLASNVFLEGLFRGEMGAECGRCLKRYCHALEGDFRLVLEPAGDRAPTEPSGVAELARDGMVLGDNLDQGWYRGPEIDLENYLGEVVALSMPVQPICREECKGLCPVCGVDRNTASCDCTQQNPESPFAVLAALRDDLTKGKT